MTGKWQRDILNNMWVPGGNHKSNQPEGKEHPAITYVKNGIEAAARQRGEQRMSLQDRSIKRSEQKERISSRNRRPLLIEMDRRRQPSCESRSTHDNKEQREDQRQSESTSGTTNFSHLHKTGENFWLHTKKAYVTFITANGSRAFVMDNQNNLLIETDIQNLQGPIA